MSFVRLSQSSLHFKDFNVFCQDYHSLLYISRTSMSFVNTIKFFFSFPRLSKSIVLQRLSMSSALYVSKTSMSFCQDYQSLLYFSKTINVFCPLRFKDFNVFLSRLSKSSLLLKDYQSLAETINVFCPLRFIDFNVFLSRLSKSSLLFQDYKSLLSCKDYQCLLPFTFQKPSKSFVRTIKVFFTFPKTIRVLFWDYQSILYISKTINVFCQDYQFPHCYSFVVHRSSTG